MNKIIRLLLPTLLYIGLAIPVAAQRPHYEKLSPMLRHLVVDRQHQQVGAQRTAVMTSTSASDSMRNNSREVCAFVRVTADADAVFARHGCRQLCRYGSLYVAMIPLEQLASLSLEKTVSRIEARPSGKALMDSVVYQINAAPAHEGLDLPECFNGRGVVMGVMDIGFDLTHPTFYSRDTTEYRIKAFWDQLSQDTIGSPFPVGRDYTTKSELLSVGHARDGLDMTHGTHTLGTAAGSGYDTNYRGIAPESDICIVANAVGDDLAYIDSADVYKYTFATDALGFKYIFDYADRVGKPCVISFSEGSGEDFWGYDQLYYEMLDSLLGPGHVIVASAGNQGRVKSWFRKPKDMPSMGTFLYSSSTSMYFTLKSADDFDLRFVSYSDPNDTLTISTRQVLQQEDSVLTVVIERDDRKLAVELMAYPSCYEPSETCYDVTLLTTKGVGAKPPLSVEILGVNADVEAFRVTGVFTENTLNPQLNAGECVRNIHSPSSSPSVICVGATIYRRGITNYLGKWKESEPGKDGMRVTASSVGPTYDGRIKPDVMAPGANIISAYSSYYLENHPKAGDITWDVAHFDFNGRTYAWNSNSGTSMSTPAVGGAIALWLQANPRLTPQDVLGVISRTSRHNDPELSYPNNEWGYGEIDVYAGLLDVLGLSGIKTISSRPTRASICFIDRQLLRVGFESPLQHKATLRLFNLSGIQLHAERLPAGIATHDLLLPLLSEGIYVVQIDGDESVTGSQLIRR